MGSLIELGGYTGDILSHSEMIDGPVVVAHSDGQRWSVVVFDQSEARVIRSVAQQYERVGLKPVSEKGFVFLCEGGSVNQPVVGESLYLQSDMIAVNG